MEKTYKFYLVSFSDSTRYQLTDDADDRLKILDKAENEIKAHLNKLFPGEAVAYYTTPRVTEISWNHRDKYADYPRLDHNAIEDIKRELAREVEVQRALAREEMNAPFNRVPPNNF